MVNLIEKKSVLVVEDDLGSRELLSRILLKNNINCITAENGEVGLSIFKEYPDLIVITDLEMPVMNGSEMITEIKKIRDDAIIIVHTGRSESEIIVSIMKQGVYDYLIKPVDADALILKLNRAVEANFHRILNKSLERERMIRLETQLEWLNYKDQRLLNSENRNHEFLHKTLFESMRINFTQGAGFGILSSILSLILISPSDEKGNKIISSEMLHLIEENEKVVESIIQKFSEIRYIIEEGFPLQDMTIHNIFQSVHKAAGALQELSGRRNHRIIINDEKGTGSEKTARMNHEYFIIALKELIINAMKFGARDSNIYVIVDFFELNLAVSVMNRIDSRFRILPEHRHLVFEPFFRIQNILHEEYLTLDYGLGLTLVDKIVKRFSGKTSINTLLNHMDSTGEFTEFSMIIPFQNP